jgi:hypothetical protein
MTTLLYSLFISIFFLDYLVFKIGVGFRIITWVPEVFSILITIIVILRAVFFKTVALNKKYVLFFSAFVLHVIICIIVNQVPAGAIIAGLRTYFKFVPLFLLPAVYDFSDQQIKKQLKFLLLLAVLQCPLAIFQRLVQFRYLGTGDVIAGTFAAAPILSIYMISVIAVLLSFFLNEEIKPKFFLMILVVLFIPTAINETKATMILLPIALIIPVLFAPRHKSKLKLMVTVWTLIAMLLVGFNFIYSQFYAKRSDVFEFYTSDQVKTYLYFGIEADEVRDIGEGEVGRIDAIIYAITENSDDFFRLVWGVGIGNASASFSNFLAGDYLEEYTRLGGRQNALSHMLWEIGILGVILVFLLFYLIFFDAKVVRNIAGTSGTLALGWIGVLVVLAMSIPYQNIISMNVISYLFCYISGYVAAKRCRMDRLVQATQRGLS